MATTFALELNNKPNKRGAYAIYLRITQNRKLKRIKTSVEVKRASDFNKNNRNEKWIRTVEPNHAVWNDALRKELEDAKKKYRELKEDGLATSDKIISEIKEGERTSSFLEYARKRTQEIYDAGGFRNWKKYNGFCNKLETYLKKKRMKDLTFAELTPAMLSKFEAHLRTLRNERDPEKMLHVNTIEVNFNIFKTLVRRAIEVEELMKTEKNPFLTYKYKGIKTVKEKLNEGEISALIDLDLQRGSLLWHSRNCFLLSYYCAGVRASDLIQLRWCNITTNGRLYYQMGKNHKVRDLVLVQQAKDILSLYRIEGAKPTDYIFPLLDSTAEYAKAITQQEKDTLPVELKKKLLSQTSSKNALVNKYLKQLATMAGIEKKVSFHISRHSFAKVAKDKGVDNSHLKNAMAHSSLEITEGYMGDFETSETDNVLVNVFVPQETTPKDKLLSLIGELDAKQVEELLQQLNK